MRTSVPFVQNHISFYTTFTEIYLQTKMDKGFSTYRCSTLNKPGNHLLNNLNRIKLSTCATLLRLFK